MKRPASLSGSNERPSKQLRRDSATGDADCFSSRNQLPFDDVRDYLANRRGEQKHLVGFANMAWKQAEGQYVRLQFQEAADEKHILGVKFVGCKFERLSFQPDSRIKYKIPLDSATLAQGQLNGSYPFHLVYKDNVKILKVENGVTETYFDSGAQPDWFGTPAPEVNRVSTSLKSLAPSASRAISTDSPPSSHQQMSSRPSASSSHGSLAAQTRNQPKTIPQQSSVDAGPKSQNSRGSLPTPSVSPPRQSVPSKRPLEQEVQASSSSSNRGHDNNSNKSNKGREQQQRVDPKSGSGKAAQPTEAQKQGTPAAPGPSKRRKNKARREISTRNPALDLAPGYTCSKGGIYKPISELTIRTKHNVVGIVVEVGQPNMSSKGGKSAPPNSSKTAAKKFAEWSLYLAVVDPSFHPKSESGNKQAWLPTVKLGQPVLLRQLFFKQFQNSVQGTGFSNSFKWAAFDGDQGCPVLSDSSSALHWAVTRDDLDYLPRIYEWWKAVQGDLIPKILPLLSPTSKPGRARIGNTSADAGGTASVPAATQANGSQYTKRGLCLIKDANQNDFIDCVVEYQHTYVKSTSIGEVVCVYVTDWTRHRHSYQDNRLGAILKIVFWGEKGEVGKGLTAGYYRMKNIRMAFDKNGNLEGHFNNESTLTKLAVTSSEVHDLLSRKEQEDSGQQTDEPAEPQTKPVHPQPERRPETPAAAFRPCTESEPKTKIEDDESMVKTYRRLQNKYKDDVHPASIATIFGNPPSELPKHYRVIARVFDYMPRDLREWVHGICKTCQKPLPKDRRGCLQCNDDVNIKLTYRFSLHVVDQNQKTMVVRVCGSRAEELLSTFPPKWLDTVDEYFRFLEYVTPILSKLNGDEEMPGPWLDFCVECSRMKLTDKIAESGQRPFYMFEFFPPRTDQGFDNLLDRISRLITLHPLAISITWGAGGSTRERSMQLARMSQSRFDVETILHMTCTNMEEGMVEEALNEAQRRGIQNILALRGDPPRGEEYWIPTDPRFMHAVDLVRYIREEFGDYFCIGVGAYPDGHPDGPSEAEQIVHLKAKVDAGADFIVTQLFYDAIRFKGWVKRVREAGITVPIIPGIMPIQSYGSFQRMTKLCKTEVPRDILDALEPIKNDDQRVKDYGVDLATRLVSQLTTDPELGIRGVHFCTLNLEKSVRKTLDRLGWSLESQGRKNRLIEDLPAAAYAISPSDASTTAVSVLIHPPSSPSLKPQDQIDAASAERAGVAAAWDEFPNGRFGDATSPAYGVGIGDQWEPGVGTLGVSRDVAISQWGNPTTTDDLNALFIRHLKSDPRTPTTPFSPDPLSEESKFILPHLLKMTERGWWTVGSQPAVDSAPSAHDVFGWGPPGGYVFQKAFVEFFCEEDVVRSLERKIKQMSGWVTWYASNAQGELVTNLNEEDRNAVTWGVFPGQEIAQSTIIERTSFLAWTEEAYSIWSQWALLYPPDSESRVLLENMRDTRWLVSIVHHDFKDPEALWNLVLDS
ncbi:hypothetical protein FRB99_006434 [Tulasnella sp. 403]|nr:hypothetical protein FRB99_006434 [Tulasnella sp. 403]